MAVVDAKCPNCGNIIKIETNRLLSGCPYCKASFNTNDAIQAYRTHIATGGKAVDNTFEIEDNKLIRYNGRSKSVTVPSGIEIIGYEAFRFEGAKDEHVLQSIILPSSVKVIEEGAFANNIVVTNIDLSECDNLVEIGPRAFSGCRSIYEIDLSKCSSLEKIGEKVFAGCKGLGSVKFPTSLTEIGQSAFMNTGLTEIDLSMIKLEKLDTQIFKSCPQLESVILANCDKVGDINKDSFPELESLLRLDFSNCKNITSINDSAFTKFKRLQYINFNGCENLQYIENNAFKDCVNLIECTFGDLPKLQVIGKNAFRGCRALENVDLSQTNIKSIEIWGFGQCPVLRTISLPESIETISSWAFNECDSIMTINLSNCINLAYIEQAAFQNCKSAQAIILPDNVNVISKSAFQGCVMAKSIKFPANVGTIEALAFADMSNLQELSFTNCSILISIDKEAFRNETSLQTIDFSNCGIQTICEEAFKGCSKLRDIKFANNENLMSVQLGAFSGCKKIKKLNISGIANGDKVFDKKAFDGVKFTTK
ncbi:MAG: leucine-rich repeat protein [bacterium]|nr:leucine-rich repeat protein [bacterium]